MSDNEKITATHLERNAYIYIRQSSASQVEHNRESTDRQYKLVKRANSLGWPHDRVQIIDQDLAHSADGRQMRCGFEKMFSEVAMGHVGLILSIEVSRLARNNSEWYRLLDLCGVMNTLIGDEDGLYHPGLFDNRLLLGLKGTMAEAELHVIRARLNGGIRNKAARGQLRRGVPVGFEWGEQEGEIRFVADQAVTHAIGIVFEKFTEFGSVRRVWLHFRSKNIKFPSRATPVSEIRWTIPTYTAIHQVLTNPVYAGAYVYGKSRQESYVDKSGNLRKRVRRLPQKDWQVFLPEHHKGFINWDTYLMNQKRIDRNTRPGPHKTGAVREGTALLQGIASCGRCGRRLRVYYQGNKGTPGYYCANSHIVNGRGEYCMRVGGLRIDNAISEAFLEAITPAGMEAALQAEEQLDSDYHATVEQWQLQVERARYQVDRAKRRYRSVEPENRLVARTLEAEWEQNLSELLRVEAELTKQQQQRPKSLSEEQRQRLQVLGTDLKSVWRAPTTTDRDRKELFGILLEEVNIRLEKSEEQSNAILMIRWKGGTINERSVNLRVYHEPAMRTDEDTIALVRRLALHYRDDTIAGILNRQRRRTATGQRFNVNRVGNLRRHWKIPRYKQTNEKRDGELVTVHKAAKILDIAPSTVHRWLADGFIAGEQLTPGAPWRIRMNEELRSRFRENSPEGYVPMMEATRILGISRQAVLQRVKRGELQAIHIRSGKRKGLRIKAVNDQPTLFN